MCGRRNLRRTLNLSLRFLMLLTPDPLSTATTLCQLRPFYVHLYSTSGSYLNSLRFQSSSPFSSIRRMQAPCFATLNVVGPFRSSYGVYFDRFHISKCARLKRDICHSWFLFGAKYVHMYHDSSMCSARHSKRPFCWREVASCCAGEAGGSQRSGRVTRWESFFAEEPGDAGHHFNLLNSKLPPSLLVLIYNGFNVPVPFLLTLSNRSQ